MKSASPEFNLDSIRNVEELEDLLSQPTPALVTALARIKGDILVLGVGGKMGPSLARMAKRASEEAGISRRVIGVARFTTVKLESQLWLQNIETLRADLLDERQLAALPEAPNIIFMAGMKFGSTGQEAVTWAMNAHLPSLVCKRFPQSRMIVFSTGNVYGLAPVAAGGSLETDSLNPVGEYAMSCLGRERIFEYFSRTSNIPMAFIRLNYASELRYGVLADLAQRIWAGENIDVSMGYLNTIWLADANAMALQALEHVSVAPRILNVTGPELLSVRQVCGELGKLLAKPVSFKGAESPTALLSNAEHALRLFGQPRISVEQVIRWTADWVKRGQPALGKPTHFESRSGRF
jgi:nucleoside-diphosphate-sugar epimerase